MNRHMKLSFTELDHQYVRYLMTTQTGGSLQGLSQHLQPDLLVGVSKLGNSYI